jgi:hypothetical protein
MAMASAHLRNALGRVCLLTALGRVAAILAALFDPTAVTASGLTFEFGSAALVPTSSLAAFRCAFVGVDCPRLFGSAFARRSASLPDAQLFSAHREFADAHRFRAAAAGDECVGECLASLRSDLLAFHARRRPTFCGAPLADLLGDIGLDASGVGVGVGVGRRTADTEGEAGARLLREGHGQPRRLPPGVPPRRTRIGALHWIRFIINYFTQKMAESLRVRNGFVVGKR